MSRNVFKITIFIAILAAVIVLHKLGIMRLISLENLKVHFSQFLNFYRSHPAQTIGVYALIYILSAALSLPGATVLTLAAGAIFGFWIGTIVVSFASTIGATLAFLVARFVFRDIVQNKFREKLQGINQGIQKEGAFYLFTLRLIPIFPFFLVNLVMGLTPIRAITYFWVSQIGMLAGTAAYVNAGTQLNRITSLNGILSGKFLISIAIIGVLPLISKTVVNTFKAKRIMKRFKKPRQFDYNLVAIGGGSAGLVSAYIGAAVKAKVALVEKHKMGGDCLNTGCVPSKAFIRSAKAFYDMKRARSFGLILQTASVDFAQVMERVQRVIGKVAPHDSRERYRNLGVDCFDGTARVSSPYEIEVTGKDEKRIVTTRAMIIATGARPFVPPIPGLESIGYLTSDTVWQIRTLPKRLVVLGGGPIGCELAQSFARFGSQVTVVEMQSQLMGREDRDVADFIQKIFEKEGVRVLTSHKAKSIVQENGQKALIAEYNGHELRIEFDEILLALGRRANVTGFGLEELGISISQRGTINHDDFMRTNFSNIYVCGDVAGPYQFTHTAAHQAWYASINALFSPLRKFKADYRVIPWATFTDPEVARVGLSERDAIEKNIPYQLTRYDLSDLDRAIAEEEDHGFVKVLTSPNSDKILGATIVGAHAGEVIAEYIAAMKHGFGLNKILGTIHIYPTFAEANKYAAGEWKKATAPKWALKWLEKIHAWRRG